MHFTQEKKRRKNYEATHFIVMLVCVSNGHVIQKEKVKTGETMFLFVKHVCVGILSTTMFLLAPTGALIVIVCY